MLYWLEWILGFLYLLLGPVMWGVFGWLMIKGKQRMSLLELAREQLPSDPPHVTILIPAKDEGERVRDCLRSALAQDYPKFDVVAINDRSTDSTGQIMDEIARVNPSIRVVHIPQGSPPEGWTGKCNALRTGVEQAAGSWLLFVDSDVILQPGALRLTIAVSVDRRFDMLSLLPRLECHSLGESTLIPLCGTALMMMFLVPLTNTNQVPNVALANGQYICIRRDVYDAIGGHAAVKDKFCEDVELARILKGRGFRPRISWGTEAAAVRMYDSLPAVVRGWARIFFAASRSSPWRIVLGIVFTLVCCLSVYPAIAWGFYRNAHPASVVRGWLWLTTGGAHWLLMSAALAIMYSWSGNPRRNALWFPVSGLTLIVVFMRSIAMCITGRVVWRGTRYTPAMKQSVAE